MDNTPFRFGTTVSSAFFVNREEEKSRLINHFRNNINSIIISPRRWGKSSLVKETARLANDKNLIFCFIDLFYIRSEEEFYNIFAREVLKACSNKIQERIAGVKDFLKQIVPKISVGVDPQSEFSLSFDWEDAKKHRDEILNLPEKIAQKKNIKIVICIDEFQNLKSFKDSEGFEKTLRSCWQNHQKTSYCLYGSKRHMMGEIFNEKNKPFYRFGELTFLQKIELKHWVPFLTEKFNLYGIEISENNAIKIAEIVKCHPYYVQQLAFNVWSLSKDKVNEEIIDYAMQNLLNSNNIFYQRELELLSNTQVNLLKAIAEGAIQHTSVDVMNKYRLGTPRNVSKNREILEKADIIDFSGTKIEFVDPVFEYWFRTHV